MLSAYHCYLKKMGRAEGGNVGGWLCEVCVTGVEYYC